MRSLSARLAGLVAAAVALALLASAAVAGSARAAPRVASHALHARYLSSVPVANATIKAAPGVVVVHCAEPVDPASSAVTVYDAKGQVVSQPAQAETNNLTTMRVPLTGDDSEVYLVVWHTTSAMDGDADVGALNFYVSASGASDLAPTTSALPQAASPASSGAPIWLVIALALAGLIVGAAASVAWSRSRAGVHTVAR